MAHVIEPGMKMRSSSGMEVQVKQLLGGGTQGDVFLAKWGDAGDFAVKWYKPEKATADQRKALEFLISEGAPSPKFLWPLDLISMPGSPSFGYIMPLRTKQFSGLADFVSGEVSPGYPALITLGHELTNAFRNLHVKGLCYKDISFGNAFFDPATGETLICDNDNVTVNRSSLGEIVGTWDFMAPEIVRGEALPSNKTDLHSLAVLLFYIFFLGHPLVGRRVLEVRSWDIPARRWLLGQNALFIFDPNDASNAAAGFDLDPIGEAGGNPLRYWTIYPSFFQNVFTKAFTEGLRDPDRRVTELEWLDVFLSLRNSLFRCACNTPNFYEQAALELSGTYSKTCWSCGRELKLPFRMRIGRSVIMMNADTKLVPCQIGNGDAFDLSSLVGEVVRHPTDPTIWGLKNLTAEKWVATLPDGSLRDVEPGRSAPLAANTRINFGRVEGEIRY